MWVLRFMLAICLGVFPVFASDLTHKNNFNGISLKKNSFHIKPALNAKTSKLPDLTIKSIKIKPNIKAGERIGKNKEIVLSIANIGKANATKSILKLTCRASKGTCPKILNSHITLNPIRKRGILKIYWGKDSKERWHKGRFYVIATVKLKTITTFATNQIQTKESNTKNNIKHFILNIKSSGYIDLTIKNIKQTKPICAKKQLSTQGKIKVTIANFGTKDAPKSTMCVKCSKTSSSQINLSTTNLPKKCPSYLSGKIKIPSLKSKKSYTLNWPLNSFHKWQKGRYKLLFEANCNDRDLIKEHDTTDNNNKKTFLLNIKECGFKPLHVKPVNPIFRPKIDKNIKFLSIIPSHWKQNKGYNTYIRGDNLNKKIEFKFSHGITVRSTHLINKKEIKLNIHIDKNAKTDKAYLLYRLKNSTNAKWYKTHLYGWIEKGFTIQKAMPKFKIKPIKANLIFPIGKIILENPDFGSFGCGGDVYQDVGIPKLNDKTVFNFREENPGLAENFQLQITNRAGKILLVENLGRTKAFHANADFVYKILELMKYPVYSLVAKQNKKIANFKKLQKTSTAKIESIIKTDSAIFKSYAHSNVKFSSEIKTSKTGNKTKFANKFDISPRDQYMNKHSNEIKLFWKVIGTRTYKKDRTAKGIKLNNKRDFITFIVESSDSWPLAINDFTTGMRCTKDHKTADINIQNLDLGKGKEPGVTSTVNYTGDHIELSGSFDLKKSPWAYRDYNSNAVWVGPRNIFISWGDGVVEPLNLKFQNDRYTINSMQHQYMSKGDRKIRLFMLPEDDIQHNDPASVVAAYNFYENSKNASLGTMFGSNDIADDSPYYQTLKYSGKVPIANTKLVDISKHAYMIYCHKITIDPRADLVASGPLHLEDLTFSGYNGGAGKSQTGNNRDKIIKNITNQFNLSTKKIIKFAEKPKLFAQNKLLEFSKCDSLQTNAKLKYYGKGSVKFKWTIIGQDNNKLSLGENTQPVGPSHQRDNLTLENYNTPSSESYSLFPIDSKVVELDKFTANKKYQIRVDATVDPYTALSLSQEELLNEVKAAASGFSNLNKFASNKITPQMFKVALNLKKSNNPYLLAIQKSGVKVGVLSPSKHLGKGMPMVASINDAIKHNLKNLSSVKIPKRKPYFVASNPFVFKITPHASGTPCKFKIITKDGDSFWIKNISKSVKEVSKGVYSGKGNIAITLNAGDGEELLLPIIIDRWQIGKDGMSVTKGLLDTEFTHKITKNGMNISLKKLHCQSKISNMDLTLDLSAQQNTLRIPGTSEALSWKDITSKLDEKGNWLYTDKREKEFSIGWSGFKIKSKNITIDLDTNRGKGVSSECASTDNGKKWTGIHLGDATLIPNTFDLLQNDYVKRVNNWGIAQTGSTTGLCGKTTLGHFSTNFKRGKISFDKIDIDTKGGNFKAIYKNMDVKVPWLDTHLKGDATLMDGQPGTESTADFRGLHSSSVTKTYKSMSFKADNLIFGSFEGIGWGVWSDTTFTFASKNGAKITDKATLNGMIFGMDARAHLPKDEKQTTLALGGKAKLGKTTVDLISADLKLHPKSGESLIDFTIKTNISVSKVLPTVSVPIKYKLNSAGDTYSSLGPIVPKFDVPVAFPAGNPNAEAKVSCDYKKDAGSNNSASIKQTKFRYLADVISNFSLTTPAYAGEASGGSTKNDQYSGSVDLSMYGGPPVKAEFRLGYEGGKDYWLMRATLSLGKNGVTFIPPLMNLYKIRGGLGYNFPVDAFKHVGTINDVYPNINGSYLFMAGLRIGSPDGFTTTCDGDLTIQIGKAARMDFRAWLLDSSHQGEGNFQGYIQYGGGNFDGALEGHMNYLNGSVKFVIPHDAMVMHFGHGNWYIYAGKKDGPRIHVYLLIMDTNGYFMLDPNSLQVGGGLNFYLNAGIGHISGNLEEGLKISVPPHISGYAEGSFEAKICCCGACVGPTVSAGVKASALPVKASAHACVDLPWPLGGVCGSFSL